VQVDDQGPQAGPDSLDPGTSPRRLVEIRCGFAELARREAEAAESRVAEAGRAFDAQLAVLAASHAARDLGATRTAKEEAHRAFRKAADEARSRSQVEAAAASWLEQVNLINSAARAAQLRIQRERDATDALASELDRLTSAAEASQGMADAAVEACRAAREALAAAEGIEVAEAADSPSGESAAAELTTARAAAQAAPVEVAPVEAETPDATLEQAAPGRPAPAFAVLGAETGAGGGPAESAGDQVRTPAAEPAVDLTGPRPPAIVPLVQRDVATMSRLVECLAGSDPEQRRRWQLCLANFVDAVVTAAIDHGCFTFPGGNPFWDQFTPDQARNVAQNLAALGFRHDGTGEFVDGRVPGQRDLSMAVGQAGLPIVRVRFWPRPQEAARLFRHVRVDTTAVLSERAPSLTKGELVRLLDRRAELVADLWNDWSRVRPLLLLQSRD
jgi:hypothetical protein